MNFSIQEFLVFAVLALIVLTIVWWVIRMVRGFGEGYRSVDKPGEDRTR